MVKTFPLRSLLKQWRDAQRRATDRRFLYGTAWREDRTVAFTALCGSFRSDRHRQPTSPYSLIVILFAQRNL
jgi:hypothetical protein